MTQFLYAVLPPVFFLMVLATSERLGIRGSELDLLRERLVMMLAGALSLVLFRSGRPGRQPALAADSRSWLKIGLVVAPSSGASTNANGAPADARPSVIDDSPIDDQ